MWLGDAAYTDHIKAGIGKADYSMPVEYVKERFQMTLDDPGKFYSLTLTDNFPTLLINVSLTYP
jgi:hypothetical protein